MQKFVITPVNADQLSKQVDQFNATVAKDHPIIINFGRDGADKSTWFVSYVSGQNTRDRLSFDRVVALVKREVEQRQMDIENGAFDAVSAFA